MVQIIGYPEADRLLDWKELVAALEDGHRRPRAQVGDQLLSRGEDVILSRAAVIDGMGVAVKTATLFPVNAREGRPTTNGAMVLFADRTGMAEALFDFHLVTKWKTAADSVLAASRLARPDSRSILVVGAGTVARSLLDAYSAMFPRAEFRIWNRTRSNADRLASELAGRHAIDVVEDLADAVAEADIVTCATMSPAPVICGDWLAPGVHLDLIGAYRPDMREADDTALRRSRIFVDSRDTTIDHIGELASPIARNIISADDVIADFYDLPTGGFTRESEEEITLFKNGGGAHLDLMTARHILDKWNRHGQIKA